jgi:hypothetical protein
MSIKHEIMPGGQVGPVVNTIADPAAPGGQRLVDADFDQHDPRQRDRIVDEARKNTAAKTKAN